MTTSERISLANPYFYGGPIKDPHGFFGREEQLQTIFERLCKAGSTSIIGQRRSGKTSLLYYLMTDAAHRAYSFDAEGFVFVYMDAEHGIRNPEDFYRRLVQAVARQVPSVVPEESSDVNEEQMESMLAKLAPRRLVLLMDEFQTIASAGDFSQDFFRALRWFATNCEVCFITATMESLDACCPREVVASPFPGIFAATYLGSWTKEEYDHFLTRTSERSGAPMQTHADAVSRLAGCFPFYVQMACSFYFDLWRKRGEGTFQDHMDVKLRFADEARPYFDRLWKSYLTVSEKVTLAALAHGKKPSDDLILRNLVQKGYVINDRIFSSALIDFVLRREAEGERLESNLSKSIVGPPEKGIWMDKRSGDVWVDRKLAPPLTNLEHKLLTCLYDRANCLCGKHEIVEAVWAGDYLDPADDARIAKLISRLREGVEPDPENPRYIVTVHGRGYKLVQASG